MKRFLVALILVVLAFPLFIPLASSESDLDPIMVKMYLATFMKTGDEEVVKKGYGKMDFKKLSRYPDDYMEEKFKIVGVVLQAQGGKTDGYYELRIATKGKYDDVVYVTCRYPGFGILDDDKLTLYVEYYGMTSYKTIMGGRVTLPGFVADLVELNE